MTNLRGLRKYGAERFILTAAVTLVFALAAFALVDFSRVGAALADVRPLHWGLCLSIMLGVSFLRFIRIAIVAPTASRLAAFRASALHGAAIAVLPGRLGEAALPIALKSAGGPGIVESAGLLLLVRSYDLAALIAMTALALTIALPASPFLWSVAAGATAGFFSAPLVVKRGLNFLHGRTPRRLLPLLDAAARLPLSGHYALLLATIGVWGGVAATSALALAATKGEFVSNAAMQGQAVLAASAASFAFASPVNGIASVGPFEGAYAGALAGFGHDPAAAITAALILHFSAVVASLAFAFAAGATMAPRPWRKELIR